MDDATFEDFAIAGSLELECGEVFDMICSCWPERISEPLPKSKNGDTFLHIAARFGRINEVTTLIDHGANVSARNKWGTTPLDEAIECGDVQVFRYLLDHGADLSEVGEYPVHRAIGMESDGEPMIKELHSMGFDINEAEKDSGRTPLHKAAHGYDNCLECLVNLGARLDIPDKAGLTPRDLAVKSRKAWGSKESIKIIDQVCWLRFALVAWP
eukprot:c12870_g1_i3.p1 GENE.c12870_g1_i3~~c12870_g1_i3.p1  ORF type:complete len:225 (+),score=39.66 c12870_g1_i3:37-675(+)